MPRATYPRPWIATGHGSCRELRPGECELKFRDENGQRHLILPCSIDEAEDLIEVRTRNRRRVAAGLPAVTTWDQAMTMYQTQLQANKASQDYIDQMAMRLKSLRDSAAVQPANVQQMHIRTWLNEVSIALQNKECDGWASTANKALAMVGAFFRWLKSLHLIADNPCEGIKKFNGREKPKRDLTMDEFRRVRRVCEPSVRDLLNFLAYTGVRFGEAANMRRNDINDQGVWQISKRKRNVALKINLSERGLLEIVLRQRPDSAGRIWRKWVSPNVNEKHFGPKPDIGAPVDAPWFKRVMATRCRIADIPPFTAHALRHAKASWSEELGVDLRVIQKSLGHAKIETTQRYAHGQTSRRVLEAQELLIEQLTDKGTGEAELWQDEDEQVDSKHA